MASLPLDTLRELMRHMEWADACVWGALLPHPAAVEDSRLRDLLLHLHGVQRAFLTLWKGESFDPAIFNAPPPGLLAMPPLVQAYYRDLHAAAASFDDATLSRPVVTPGLSQYEQTLGRRFDIPTLAETVLQVSQHSTYHRGQVNARLREVGGEPPLVDYIAWIWFGRPAADWNAVALQIGQAVSS